MRVELWDDDIYSGDDSLGFDLTDDSGYFSIPPVTNWEGSSDRQQDIYLRIIAENEAAVVKQSYNGSTYVIQGPTRSECPSGVYDTTIVLSNAESGAFFVADAALTARDKWLQLRSDKNPGQVQVVLTALNDTTSYSTGNQYIRVSSSVNNAMWTPDTWDRGVIVHEYGHRLEDVFDFFDNSSGGAHTWFDQTWLAKGASEGFSDWLPSQVASSTKWYNTRKNCTDSAWYNLENGQAGVGDTTDQQYGSANNFGSYCEGAVAAIMWDISDGNNDDWSTYDFIFPLPNVMRPDGTWDTLSLGTSGVLSTLLDRTRNGHHPDDIRDFWVAWHNSPTLGHTKGLRDVYYEHGDDIFVSCCIGVRGDVDMNGIVDMSDLSALTSNLTGGGYVLPCPAEANVNGVGIIDLSDMAALVSYLTGGGYVLPSC